VGQTFFNASGDSGAFTTGANSVNAVDKPSTYNAPSSNPYITQVGGTTLSMNNEDTAWSSEVVWSYSSGGISSYYKIPSWQTNISNLAGRGGSTKYRNIPDVAANADNIYLLYNNNDTNPIATDDNQGTSAAAPLWAGFTALVNEQLAAQGRKSIGFINPALYAIARGTNYSECFHDVVHGNNTWYYSPHLFYATNNYDLCTGLGTMGGTNLINALATPIPQPQLKPLVFKAGTVTLSWSTVTGQVYQLQYNSTMNATGWTNLGHATNAAKTTISVTEPSTNGLRFYRVILQP
jgi:kumamolisin